MKLQKHYLLLLFQNYVYMIFIISLKREEKTKQVYLLSLLCSIRLHLLDLK